MSSHAERQTLNALLDPPLSTGFPPTMALALALTAALHLVLILGVSVTPPESAQPPSASTLELLVLNEAGTVLDQAPDEAALSRLNRLGESARGDGVRSMQGIDAVADTEPPGADTVDRRLDQASPDARDNRPSEPGQAAQPLALLAAQASEFTAPSARPVVDAARILASASTEIERLSDELQARASTYASRVRRRSISASTREFRYASYLGAWARKVERIGNLNYPREAREQQLYGSLILHVAVRADGSVERIRVVRSSGHALLDEAAIHIVELAAPFSPFPPDIAAETDVLDIVRTWQFLRGGVLGWE